MPPKKEKKINNSKAADIGKIRQEEEKLVSVEGWM